MKVRKKPVIVDALGPLTEAIMVATAHGRVRAEAGDYILTDPKTGDRWPIKPDIFQQTYEIVQGEQHDDDSDNRPGGSERSGEF